MRRSHQGAIRKKAKPSTATGIPVHYTELTILIT